MASCDLSGYPVLGIFVLRICWVIMCILAYVEYLDDPNGESINFLNCHDGCFWVRLLLSGPFHSLFWSEPLDHYHYIYWTL